MSIPSRFHQQQHRLTVLNGNCREKLFVIKFNLQLLTKLFHRPVDNLNHHPSSYHHSFGATDKQSVLNSLCICLESLATWPSFDFAHWDSLRLAKSAATYSKVGQHTVWGGRKNNWGNWWLADNIIRNWEKFRVVRPSPRNCRLVTELKVFLFNCPFISVVFLFLRFSSVRCPSLRSNPINNIPNPLIWRQKAHFEVQFARWLAVYVVYGLFMYWQRGLRKRS